MIKDDNLVLKEKFLEYFKEVPIQKFAAAHIGRHEDTITDWKTADSDFSDQIEAAKAEYVKKQLKGVRSKEWTLERLFKDHFAQRQEHTGEGGAPIQFGNLSDEQLDKLIAAKVRKAGTTPANAGKGTEDTGESA